MAIVELQFRKHRFLSYFQAEVNRQRLPFPTLRLPFIKLEGKLLEQIECIGGTVEPSAGAGQVTIQAQLAIYYHPSLATIQAAGSLQRGVTESVQLTLPVVLSVEFVGPGAQPEFRWTVAYGLFPPAVMPISLPGGLSFTSGAIEADEEVIAIRLGTQSNDPVYAPIVSRLGEDDWNQLMPGELISQLITRTLSETLAEALSNSDELQLTKGAYGAWYPYAFGYPWKPPFAMAQAEVTAVDKCLFDIDIAVGLTLIAEFEAVGASLYTVLTITWDPDSTLCDITGAILFPPAGIAIHLGVEAKTSERILGAAVAPNGFEKISATDDSIKYRSSTYIRSPSLDCVITHSQMIPEGLLASGTLRIRPLISRLLGSVSPPTSGLKTDCSTKRVAVEFREAEVELSNIGMRGQPRLLNLLQQPGILFTPPDAWMAVPNSTNDGALALKFVDPPAGRLPVGTATSVILLTDYGVRWVDLGVIPADREPPTLGEIANMLSQCMAIRDPWGMGVMNLDWLVDPPDLLHGIQPLRQWTIGAREVPGDVHLEFMALDPRGAERMIGVMRGRPNVTAQITTLADETLQIRAGRRISAPAPIVVQRWIVPFASFQLQEAPVALTAVEGAIAIRGASGETQIVEIGPGSIPTIETLNRNRPADSQVKRLLSNITRAERRGREPWATEARLDRVTVAVTRGQQLILGRLGPITKM